MKLHIITIGKPGLEYAQVGWAEYHSRLSRIHSLRVTYLQDRFADNPAKISEAQGSSFKVVTEVGAKQFSSKELSERLGKLELMSKEVSFVVGGPNGLPSLIRESADLSWSLSRLTLPHDLALVVMAEALYRASMINSGLPYHR